MAQDASAEKITSETREMVTVFFKRTASWGRSRKNIAAVTNFNIYWSLQIDLKDLKRKLSKFSNKSLQKI